MYQYTEFDRQFVILREAQRREQLERWQKGSDGSALPGTAGAGKVVSPSFFCCRGPRGNLSRDQQVP